MDLEETIKQYENQRFEIIQRLKTLRSELAKAQKNATKWRKKRDLLKNERKALLEKVQPLIETRDRNKSELEQLQRRREFLKRQRKAKSYSGFTVLDDYQLDKLTLVELKYRLYELEFFQQTNPLSREDEEVLIDEISRVEKKIEELESEGRKLREQYLGKVPKNKLEIDKEIISLEKGINNIKSNRLEYNAKIQKIYEKINPLKAQEDDAHEKFVENLKIIDENKVLIESLQEELESLKGKIVQAKKMLRQKEASKVVSQVEDRVKTLLDKKSKGEELTEEEMEYLMAHGYVPF